MPTVDVLTLLQATIERVVHLASLRSLTSCPVDKMYSTIPMDEFIHMLITDIDYLKAEKANNLLQQHNSLGSLELYQTAVMQMRNHFEYNPEFIRQTLALAEHDNQRLTEAVTKAIYATN